MWLLVLLFCFLIVNGTYSNQTSNYFEAKIYKGYDVGIHQYSYAVFLYFENTRPSSCGASLIMVQAVLTAAHCVDELRYRRGQMNAFLGATVPKDATVVRKVVDFTTHPRYNEADGSSNLAVAFLDNGVPLMHNIKKVPLAASDPGLDVEVMAVGWGKQTFGKLPDFSRYRSLKATKQVIISGKDCKEKSGLPISPRSLCTMPLIGHFYKDDAGNGIVISKPSHILVGVLSYVTNDIGIYTNVFAERNWIIGTCFSLFKKNCANGKIVINNNIV